MVLVLMALVVGGAGLLRFFFVPPHHAMYVDEPWYAEAACNLVRRGSLVLCEATWAGERCVPYEKAPGWPILLASWAWLSGCATSIGIDVNRVLGTAAVLLVAIAVRCAGGTWWQGILAAAILAIHPVHVAWSATGETNVSAAAVGLAGLCGSLLYVRTARRSGAALAVAALGLSTAIRPELFLVAVASAGITALAARAPRNERRLVGGAVFVVAATSLVSGLGLWVMNQSISGGAFLSPEGFGRTIVSLTEADSSRVHGVIVLLALAGAIVLARSGERTVAFLLLGSLIAAAVPVLAYDRFADRMLLTATVMALPLGGFVFGPSATDMRRHAAASRFRIVAAGLLFVAIAFFWRDALESASDPSETQILETRIAARIGGTDFPGDSLFVGTQPTVLAAAGMTNVMAIENALQKTNDLARAIDAGKPIYFLCDMFCEKDFGGRVTPSRCNEILERYALTPAVQETLHPRTYALYRITGPNDGSPAPDCPRPRQLGGS